MTTSDSPLTILESDCDGVRVLTIAGRLDAHSEVEAATTLENAATKNARILIDCTGLMFVSSSGLRAIIMAHRVAREHEGRIALFVPNPEIMETIRISGISKIIAIHSARSDALSTLKS